MPVTSDGEDSVSAFQKASDAEAEGELVSLLSRARELATRLGALDEKPASPGQETSPGFVAMRLLRSVIRPLEEAIGASDPRREGAGSAERNDSGSGEGATAGKGAIDVAATTDERLWQLAVDATRLRAASPPPAELQEATAALQDLACRAGAELGDAELGEDVVTARRGELNEIQAELACAIQSQTNGPYLVTNAQNLTNWLGERMPTQPQMALCRCGGSTIKPFCDGTHAEIGFTSEKDPKRVPDRRDTYVGQQVTILDNRGTCQHSGFCTDRLATVFRVDTEPFVAPSGGRMDEIIRAVRDCPSGALSYAIDGVEERDDVDYHGKRDPAIEVSKDGPYRITGGVELIDGQGNGEQRNAGASREHYALCRCGHSQNKPFCSGMHWYVEFRDPVPDPNHAPTIFEWAGGLPALTRMTRLFYEKYVPQDPLLAPLFANMSADHPERVAKWLGEVFCGPKDYSEQYGGYVRMISQHLGKGITEEKRARWVELLLASARDAGLPNDAEFRSTFASYIEWGSHLAVENSQADSHPPEHMPMPHWDWHTAAGAPGSRISALAPVGEEDDEPVELPGPQETVSYEQHIRTLFRKRDRQSMEFAFDLWAYDDVKKNAQAILERLINGSMPCDGPWTQEKIDAFERWVATGTHP